MKITIDRPGLDPRTMDGAELASFITAFCTAVRKASGDDSQAYVALEAIEANCISLSFRPASRRAMRAYAELALGIAVGAVPYPVACADSLADINRFCARNQVTVSLPVNGRRGTRVQLGVDNPIPIPTARTVEDYAILYGELVDVGGADPNVHLLVDGRRITCKVTRHQAQELARRLYDTVGVEGDVVRDQSDGRILSMQVTGILPYRWHPGDDPIKALRDLERRHRCFAGVDAGAWVRDLRGTAP